jgi:nucleoid DNA-binding protein|tara:strand:+ start:564 stop:1193 length:630 start_codon:yes stop_codon:yes gene_type:complete
MLSFKDLHEKKTKIKLNPKKEDVMEGDKTLNHGDDCNCMKCDKKRRKEDLGDEKTVSTEETAYVSQEEVSEESDQEIDQEETSTLLTFGQFDERTRYAKETGKDPQTGNESKKGGTMKGSAMAAVRKDLVKSGGLMSSRKKAINPQGKKKEKGVKSDVGTGKYKKMADNKKAQADKAKKAGFKNTQSYADTMARYGGEDNYKKGRGLGS